MLTGATTPERDPARIPRRLPTRPGAGPGPVPEPGHHRVRTVVLAVLLVALAAAFGAGTWGYAGQIDAEVLQVHHGGGGGHGGLVVAGFDDGTVSLRPDASPRSDPLRTGDVYGLTWPGGAGVLSGPPVLQPDGEVQRALKVTDGAAPRPGVRATFTRSVWRDPTSAYGVGYQDVRYPCAGGTCPAWYVPGRGTTWMLLVHGRGASRTEPLRALGPALRAHLPALDISYRNDVGAPRDPSGRYGYGTTEWRDLDAAVTWATHRGARHVVLFGASMGGAIVASFLQHSTRADLVTGVVLDAPALDLHGLVDAVDVAQHSLPIIGMPMPHLATAAAEQVASWRYGTQWADYLRGDWLRVPALVFQGTADGTVPPATSERLRALYPGLVHLVRVRGAQHVRSWNVDPAAYERHESAFLQCVTGAAPAEGCGTAG